MSDEIISYSIVESGADGGTTERKNEVGWPSLLIELGKIVPVTVNLPDSTDTGFGFAPKYNVNTATIIGTT